MESYAYKVKGIVEIGLELIESLALAESTDGPSVFSSAADALKHVEQVRRVAAKFNDVAAVEKAKLIIDSVPAKFDSETVKILGFRLDDMFGRGLRDGLRASDPATESYQRLMKDSEPQD